MTREAADVHLVDHRRGERPAQRPVALPIVGGRIHHDALHGRGRVVAWPAGGCPVIAGRHGHGATVRVQQDLVRIVPQALLRRVGADGPIGVDLARLQVRDERVPVVVGAMLRRRKPDHLGGRGVDTIEQQQLDRLGLVGVDAEVYAASHRRGAQRIGRVWHEIRRYLGIKNLRMFNATRCERVVAQSVHSTYYPSDKSR